MGRWGLSRYVLDLLLSRKKSLADREKGEGETNVHASLFPFPYFCKKSKEMHVRLVGT